MLTWSDVLDYLKEKAEKYPAFLKENPTIWDSLEQEAYPIRFIYEARDGDDTVAIVDGTVLEF